MTMALTATSLASAPRSSPVDAVPLHRRPVDFVQLVRSVLEPLQHEARALDVELRIDAPHDLGALEIDPEKIAWVVATLVGNALRYVRRGSRRLPGGTVVVRLQRDRPSNAIAIAVEDDGPGIPAEKIRYLFERQAGSQHAIGLSLTLVHDIVTAHGGDVAIESSNDALTHGTVVRLVLPAA
jgi:signal transduction histidine kinase